MSTPPNNNAPRWYNTKEGVTYAAANLTHFNELVQARNDASKSRENLECFVVRGIWFLDAHGYVRYCDPPFYYKSKANETAVMSIETFRKENKVMTLNEWFDFVNENNVHWKYNLVSSIKMPLAHIPCPCCGNSWTMENSDDVHVAHEQIEIPLSDFVGQTLTNAHKFVISGKGKYNDAVYCIHEELIRHDRFINKTPIYDGASHVMNEKGIVGSVPFKDGVIIEPDIYVVQSGDVGLFIVTRYYHRQCYQKTMNATLLKEFSETIEKAGIRIDHHKEIQNENDPNAFIGVRFLFYTSIGVIKIGWWNRVIYCEVESLMASNDTFKSVVTLPYTGGYEQCSEVLQMYKKVLCN